MVPSGPRVKHPVSFGRHKETVRIGNPGKHIMSSCSSKNKWKFCANEIRISMTQQGDPGENAVTERINGIIKEEFNCRAFLSFDLAKVAITKSIQAYNQLRPPASCDYLPPTKHNSKKEHLKSVGENRKENPLLTRTS